MEKVKEYNVGLTGYLGKEAVMSEKLLSSAGQSKRSFMQEIDEYIIAKKKKNAADPIDMCHILCVYEIVDIFLDGEMYEARLDWNRCVK